MVSRRTRVIRVGALGVVGLGLAFLMGASLISRPSSVSSASPVSGGRLVGVAVAGTAARPGDSRVGHVPGDERIGRLVA